MKKIAIFAAAVGVAAVTAGLAVYGYKKLREELKDLEDIELDIEFEEEDENVEMEDADVAKEFDSEKCNCGEDCACEDKCDENCDCNCDCEKKEK